MKLPPYPVNDFLASRTFDEEFGLTDNRDLYGVTDAFFEIIVTFFPRAGQKSRVRSRVDGPACR